MNIVLPWCRWYRLNILAIGNMELKDSCKRGVSTRSFDPKTVKQQVLFCFQEHQIELLLESVISQGLQAQTGKKCTIQLAHQRRVTAKNTENGRRDIENQRKEESGNSGCHDTNFQSEDFRITNTLDVAPVIRGYSKG